jgi:glycosyltransferase involved in cell wall biosynthesis
VNIYGLAPVSGACHWYRIREPLRGLAGLGHSTEWGELFDESIVRRHDTILTHILHGEVESQAWEWLAEAGQHRLIYDIDDNIWAYLQDTEHGEYWNAERCAQVEANIKLAHLVTTPSPILADIIRFKLGLNDNVAVLGNYIPEWVLNLRYKTPLKFTVGYQGAPQRIHQSDLDEIQEELFWFLTKCPDARLAFYGQPKPLEGAGPFADRVEYIPWQPDVPAYFRSLQGITVGIGPLQRNPFTECKSGIRAVEFAALGIPGVFSSLPAYREVVKHRETGYLVTNIRDWRKHLIKLYQRPDLVQQIGKRAHKAAEDWTTEGNAWRFELAYQGSGPGILSSSPP